MVVPVRLVVVVFAIATIVLVDVHDRAFAICSVPCGGQRAGRSCKNDEEYVAHFLRVVSLLSPYEEIVNTHFKPTF